ncbi:hypothetical protein EVAR_81626_1 [Eumeta japonica]|uniref:Uncharacterized protein n=1 Tax=Eumeta variegata TaxID=151549 RepID=A0A4C1WCD9_EUMVA|nr:hypothetical protein EVAR_81626_1 [Eumeta japonica]
MERAEHTNGRVLMFLSGVSRTLEKDRKKRHSEREPSRGTRRPPTGGATAALELLSSFSYGNNEMAAERGVEGEGLWTNASDPVKVPFYHLAYGILKMFFDQITFNSSVVRDGVVLYEDA